MSVVVMGMLQSISPQKRCRSILVRIESKRLPIWTDGLATCAALPLLGEASFALCSIPQSSVVYILRISYLYTLLKSLSVLEIISWWGQRLTHFLCIIFSLIFSTHQYAFWLVKEHSKDYVFFYPHKNTCFKNGQTIPGGEYSFYFGRKEKEKPLRLLISYLERHGEQY